MTYISTYEVFEVVNGLIKETHPVADETHMTPYFQSMVRAYRIAAEFARTSTVRVTTIHPAAIFGGRNTGGGITDYMENLAARNWHRVPFINDSSFPVVHVDSLTDAIIKSLDRPTAYIISDQMTTLKEIAQIMRSQTSSYVPVIMPLPLVKFGVSMVEGIARMIGVMPFASAVQIDFLTKGWRPDPAKAISQLNWKPMPLHEGIRRFLSGKGPSSRDELDSHGGGPSGRSGELTSVIARLELMTAAGLILYWLLYFTVGLAPDEPPPGYFVFQNTFTVSDVILALLLFRAGTFLRSHDAERRIAGRSLTLICAGALLFLGGLDISFNFQNEIYATLSFDVVLEAIVNVWCLTFGLLLILRFGPKAFLR